MDGVSLNLQNKMRTLIKLIIVVFVQITISCSFDSPVLVEKNTNIISYKDRFFLSAEEIERLENKASQGDSKSAERLVEYWILYNDNEQEARKWMSDDLQMNARANQ